MSYKRGRQRLNRKKVLAGTILLTLCGLCILGLVVRRSRQAQPVDAGAQIARQGISYLTQPELDVELLTVNEYSRPGLPLEEVKGIVVHYTANPGTTAIENQKYFEGLKDSHITKASSHFIIGLEGEIVQCIPTSEISYASNERNVDTISIECCHKDDSGRFTKETYQSLVELCAYLMGRFELNSEDLLRHYDVTGKNCPKYFVENQSAWDTFKEDVNSFILKNGEK
ncbi:MAG: N-acetylmuramoyl-L-alanine amidase family protein [Lachnospiraceae bacterium]